ncbi:hypothetical protein U14_02196 [Candidatus Moduliflexus flocculans]|uniref:Uncharacterized protein n=1 Tax=Candidatus Moduliflexus flocculans TaxID=1499966 RepID=A0A0S6VTS4_9BACT|nr:hypothetical protein U14_02196 [Candidatus Moduliflexus flocculans]
MEWLLALQSPPDGTAELADVVAALDHCLLSGVARFDTSHETALNALHRIFRGTPLQDALDHSVPTLLRNEFVERHFAVIAAVRSALSGTWHDALQRQCTDALGRTLEDNTASAASPDMPPPIAVWLESTRQWLMEIALAGFAKLERANLLPFLRTLEQIQAEPQLLRLSTLLTGFINELLNNVPVADANSVPLTRWADLWTRAMTNALAIPSDPASETVSGEFACFGIDLHRHANMISLMAYGVLTNDAGARFVRTTLSSYKVDAIIGNETWLLFSDAAPLFEALAKNQTLALTDMPLLPTGDLIWNGQTAAGNKFNPLKQAEAWFAPGASASPTTCVMFPADRHPAQIAIPIFLKDYAVAQTDDGAIWLDFGASGRLPVATRRICAFSELTPEVAAHSSQMFGLLRFDQQRWEIQPLGVSATVKKKNVTMFSGESAAAVLKKPPKTSTIAILQERASRLLRGQ